MPLVSVRDSCSFEALLRLAHLLKAVALLEDRICEPSQGERPLVICVDHLLRKGYRDGNAVKGRNECVSPDLRITDARIHLLVLILEVANLRDGLQLHTFLFCQLLVTGLVEKVCPAEADEGHLQQRVLHEEACHDAGYRHQVVPDSETLRLAGEHPEEHIR